MKTKTLTLTGILLLFALTIVSCSDDEDLKPITIKNDSRTTIKLHYPDPISYEYSYSLEGGNGNYSIQSENDEIVTAEMISSVDFRLKVINLGETTVTIEDNSQNKLILNVLVDYESHTYVIKKHDIMIVGDDLTTNEKKAIQEKYLAEIPVEVGGSYHLVYSDRPNNNGGRAFIFENAITSYRIETTFEDKKLEHTNIPGSVSWGHEITINDEKRVLILGRYYPSAQSRDMPAPPMALMEDITQKVQAEYPKAELVFTSQVIDMNTY